MIRIKEASRVFFRLQFHKGGVADKIRECLAGSEVVGLF